MASTDFLLVVAAIIGLGVSAQLLAARFRVPSVLFLITAGIVLGPEGLGVVTLENLGGIDALSTIVGVSVAIIVFEGAFHLKIDKLRQAPSAVIRLITLGAAIAFVGTAVATHYLIGADWGISLLIGALLVATGPTVVTPILAVVPVRDRVAAALETEGIVNDVTAAIAAIVVFKALASAEIHVDTYVQDFVSRLGVGLFVGVVVAAIVWAVLQYVDMSPDDAPQNARLLTLAGAVVAFGAADWVYSEAGVAAAATAGLVLGNAGLPYEEEIEAFKGDVTLIVLSFVFIALAALLDFDRLSALGFGGLALVVVVMGVLRPAVVFLSTSGKRFTAREKLFMSAVGPRGIIPASVATLFAIRLQDSEPPTNVAGAKLLVGTVFLVILVTVVVEGGFARQIAERLDVIPMRVLIVGGGKVGRSLAERLEARGENVVLIEADETILERARSEGFTVHAGDGTNTEVLLAAGAENAKIVVAATGDDDANLLIAQLVKSKFDVDRVIARANNPANVDAFEELDVRTISSSESTAWAIDNLIERPALSNWMTEIGRSGDVQEIEITSEHVAGQRIVEISDELPNGVLIALVSRDGESEVPDPELTLKLGDHVTLLGRTEAVHETLDRWHPHD
ncbi:cation:proton antiporter [Halosolutus gelatinilyticus]|uniref:cation:proton antiporter domain-containing protein n=1 Tax=Halosolutus gelatinilyticus TaxID=2931975 RepID=UPI001FF3287F|nr:cation:proton antiporter [Halosolutus gelatinilyticus]